MIIRYSPTIDFFVDKIIYNSILMLLTALGHKQTEQTVASAEQNFPKLQLLKKQTNWVKKQTVLSIKKSAISLTFIVNYLHPIFKNFLLKYIQHCITRSKTL